MLKASRVLIALTVLAWAGTAQAATISFTGTLSEAKRVFTTTVDLPTAGALTLQTYGFGGGTNGAGEVIAAGGVDPLVAVFAGSGDDAAFVEGTSDILTNYGSFVGCPPAGTVAHGTESVCGDIRMSLALPAGTYTVLLTNAAYIPAALFYGAGTLGDGFWNLGPEAPPFQTCFTDGSCLDVTSNWALDLTMGDTPDTPVPEPATLALTGVGLLTATFARRVRARRKF